jgi:anti-anti-sigma regulatory factor
VDLGELTFADSSLMLDLAIVARRLRIAGRRLHLRNAQPQVWRVIEVVGVNRLPGVVAEPDAPVPV